MNFKLSTPVYLTNFLNSLSVKLYTRKINHGYKIKYVVTDTRKYNGKGGIFFAIKGQNFDGHKFIPEIIDKIDYVIISDSNALIQRYRSKFILVENTVTALDKLASLYRSLFNKVKVIAVVGSNGKTTTKELISHIFSKKFNTLATYANQNNLLGVAYTLFNLNPKTQYCIIEAGISLPGEMDIIASTIKPDSVVITNIGKEHLQYLVDIKTVFEEETKIVKYLSTDGTLILNKNDVYLKTLTWAGTKKYYGFITNTENNLDVYIEKFHTAENYTKISVIIKDELGLKLRLPEIKTKLLGIYNVYNILAAIATSFFNGMKDVQTITEAISEFNPVSMRGDRFVINHNILVDESYNSNPDSMSCSIKEFMNIFCKREKVIVLGDMLELGEHSVEEHKNLKNLIDFDKINSLYLIGENMKYLYEVLNETERNKVKYCTTKEELISQLTQLLKNNKNLAVLFKASHATGLHLVVEKLRELKTLFKKGN